MSRRESSSTSSSTSGSTDETCSFAASWTPACGSTGSTLVRLEGGLTGETYDADELVGVDPVDGKPLLARYDLTAAAASLGAGSLATRRVGGLWRWREILPVRDWRYVASLGEGATPLLDAHRLGRHFGLPNLLIKSESLNPGGSFKARGMAVAVSRAAELGAKRLIAPSAGNAASALAAYAARAGLPATVVMPADAPVSNQQAVLAAGAQLLLLEGLISDCGALARAIADATGAFDLSTLKEPYRVEGKKTMGLELAEDLDWTLPDCIVYPTGGGTGLVGMWKAFDELEQLGLIGSKRPRMFVVQTEGCAPIVRAFAAGERFAQPWENARTSAGGLRVPAAIGDFLILDYVRESGGAAVAVAEADLAPTQELIGNTGGGYLSLESAAAVAALPTLAADGHISRDDQVVVFDTGAGLASSTSEVVAPLTPIPNDPTQWEEIVDAMRQGAA